MNLEDTIAAMATPVGQSGIGIVRMSGKGSFPIAKKIFRSYRKVNWSSSFRLYYGWIVNPETGQQVDEILLTLMRAPRTYTREDIVEINCHGGLVPLRRTLEIVIKLGARLAEPGEFTQRAFLKGRIDLTQAESVLEIVQAKTEKSLEVALHQLEGKLSRKINLLKEKMVDLLSFLEAEIDFAYEEIEFLSKKEKESRVKQILAALDSLLQGSEAGRIYQEGIKAVIVGKPNAGKSSLLNALLQMERAIVTSIPGTTRDTIEEMINLKGFPLWLIDTAGLREVKGIVEKAGIKRTCSSIAQADIILLVIDGSLPLNEEDEFIFQRIKGKKKILVINKIDLPRRIKKERIRALFPQERMVEISATQEINLEELREEIAHFILKQALSFLPPPLITNLRQKKALEGARETMSRALEGMRKGLSEEFLALDLREGMKKLGEITGEVVNEEILERIFSRFCIGK